MQTFLPYPDFRRCARVLDYQRLGKQRVEAMQICHTIVEGRKAWSNHPAVNMWRGWERHLAGYHNVVVTEWKLRLYNNTMRLLPDAVYECPPWVTPELCRSHRSNLLRKRPDHYGKFWRLPDDLPYVWPS